MSRHIPPEKVTAWVQTHFPDYKTRKDGQELVINNPFNGDTGFNFNINVKGMCHDWRGDHWAKTNPNTGKLRRSFVSFVSLFLNCSHDAAVRSILGQTNYNPFQQLRAAPEPEEEEIELPPGSMPIVDSATKKIAKMCANWLRSRGLTEDDIRKHDIHHAGTNVVWPYYEYGIMVYWQQRSILGKQFLFPDKAVADKDYFYGWDQTEPAGHVIITEAIIDSLSLQQQALASGGAALTPRQVQKLRLIDPKDGIILAPDNDGPGRASVQDNVGLLSILPYKLYYSIPPKVEYRQGEFTKDWNDVLLHVCGRDKRRTVGLLLQGVSRATPTNLAALWA